MMDTERSGLDEAMDVGSSTVSHLKSLKTAATFSKAGYGAALGGPFTAAIGAVIANRNQLAKILLVILAILLLPVLFIVMLPGLIFGSLTEQSDVLNSNSMISENIRASREAIVEVLEESHEDILAEIHAAISRLPQGDTASINDPYTYSISVNANLLISQFCASQDDYKNINLNQLKKLIRENKEGLFSYDVATETVTMEVTVDGGAEGESGTEQGQEQTQTVTFTKHTYTVVYAGDSYFADHVFHLTDKQKELAKNYAENLTAFFGTASSGIVAAINLSDEVLSYRPAVERAAAKYGMSDYVDLILAVMMQESGGRGLDVMQAAEGGFNTRYPHVPNGITDPEYSIECGVQELKYALDKAGCTGPTDLDRIKLALQGYNYGSAYIDWAMERDGGYTKENAIAYSDMMCARPSWPYDLYGDKEYVDHVLRYYQITASGGSYPANGMQIPHYLQTDYGNIPYGGGSIASSGCGPTSQVKIEGVLHEFSSIPGVKEDVTEIIMNIKSLAIQNNSETDEPKVAYIEYEGEGVVTAADIKADSDIVIMNPDQVIATLNGGTNCKLYMELTITKGRGYISADKGKTDDMPIGVIAVDSIYTPVDRVNYKVENTRVGQVTDYDKLTMDIWTNGTLAPDEVVSLAAKVLSAHLNLFIDLSENAKSAEIMIEKESNEKEKVLEMNIDELELSVRSYNCLKRAGINTVEELCSKTPEDMMKVRNLGRKSLEEVLGKLKELGLQLNPSEE